MSHDETASESVNIVTEENSCVGSSSLSWRTIHPEGPTQAFYTPDWLAKDMAGLAHIRTGSIVVEPSAGYGALGHAAVSAGAKKSHVTCIELNKTACDELSRSGFSPVRSDFLLCYSNPIFDVALMNPPSHDDRYVDHVLHALDFLKPGGILVALIVNRFMVKPWRTLSDSEYKLRCITEKVGRLYQIAYPNFAVQTQKIDASILVIENLK